MGLLAKAKDLDDLCRQVRRMESSPAAVLFEGVMDRVADCVARTLAGRRRTASSSSALPRTSPTSQLARLESYLPFLATTGNITHLSACWATVMGIIDAFREIGAQGTASISAVAPGVAEDSIATAAACLPRSLRSSPTTIT